MDLEDIKMKIRKTEECLKKMRGAVYLYRDISEGDGGESDSEVSKKLENLLEEIKNYLPQGFDLWHSKLIQHIGWGQYVDFYDIYNSDIASELNALDEYKEKICCFDAIRKLHPRINIFLDRVLERDLDGSLSLSFRSIDTRLRSVLNEITKSKSTVRMVKEVFCEKKMRAVLPNVNQQAVIDFITGVLGIDRNFFIHNEFEESGSINDLRYVIAKMIISSEVHFLLDKCEIKKGGKWLSLKEDIINSF